jgi:hypothetical protein
MRSAEDAQSRTGGANYELERIFSIEAPAYVVSSYWDIPD